MTLGITILNIGLEEIATGLGVTLPDLQWVVGVYPLVFAALLLRAGSLSDRIGRKRMFIVGVGVFTASSVACGLATGPLALTMARAVQGIGAAMTYAPAIPLLAQAYPPQRRCLGDGCSAVSAPARRRWGRWPVVRFPTPSAGGQCSSSTSCPVCCC